MMNTEPSKKPWLRMIQGGFALGESCVCDVCRVTSFLVMASWVGGRWRGRRCLACHRESVSLYRFNSNPWSEEAR